MLRYGPRTVQVVSESPGEQVGRRGCGERDHASAEWVAQGVVKVVPTSTWCPPSFFEFILYIYSLCLCLFGVFESRAVSGKTAPFWQASEGTRFAGWRVNKHGTE